MKAPDFIISQLLQRYRWYRLLEIFLTSVGISAFVFALMWWMSSATSAGYASLLIFVITLPTLIFVYRLHAFNRSDIVRYLNQRYVTLEHSADLLLMPTDQLSPLQNMQRDKVMIVLQKLYPDISFPHHLQRAFIVLIAGVTTAVMMSAFGFRSSVPSIHCSDSVSTIAASPLPSIVKSVEVNISPPAYTGLPSFTSKSLTLQAPEGSEVQWKISFSGEVNHAKLIFSGRDSLALNDRTTKRILASGFYQLQWESQGKIIRSDFYPIEVRTDEAPKIEVLNLPQFIKLKVTDPPMITVSSTLTDDYQLTDASIIATVSKGSGESVKFREEKIKFARPTTIRGKRVQAEQTLNIQKLGLEPGDELYFYVEAFDNKVPTPNRSRTETFFIALEDTTQVEAVADEGLGVDLMPDYFRSQRQIIIDTEKLLKEKKKLAKTTFNATSNELGFDQKTLRLKYGEFLGEEAESGIGIAAAEHHDEDHDDEEEDPTKKYGHQHDTNNEHHLVQEKKDQHQHKDPTDPDAKEDPLAAFAHNHDDSETATFFIQSTRAKLKAALTVMWDAELYLRLFQPEKSLPYQYTALKLLKEISNDSRIYVHRTGFDPPPLKEEKRLSADLSEVHSPTRQEQGEKKNELIFIRQASVLLEKMMLKNDFKASASDQLLFQKAGQEYATFALQNPMRLQGLTLLKQLSENSFVENHSVADAQYLLQALWAALPEQPASPAQSSNSGHPLDELFIQQLRKARHE